MRRASDNMVSAIAVVLRFADTYMRSGSSVFQMEFSAKTS